MNSIDTYLTRKLYLLLKAERRLGVLKDRLGYDVSGNTLLIALKKEKSGMIVCD